MARRHGGAVYQKKLQNFRWMVSVSLCGSVGAIFARTITSTSFNSLSVSFMGLFCSKLNQQRQPDDTQMVFSRLHGCSMSNSRLSSKSVKSNSNSISFVSKASSPSTSKSMFPSDVDDILNSRNNMPPRKMTLEDEHVDASSVLGNVFGSVNKTNTGTTPLNPVNGSESKTSPQWRSYSVDELGTGAAYKLGISSMIPRPVGVLTTVSENGIVNCAPFSYTGLNSHDPPIVSHGICINGNGSKKDSLANIEHSKEWVCHVLTTDFLDEANECAATLPHDQSEVTANGLELLNCDIVSTPRLSRAPIAMECKLWDKKEIYNDAGKHTTTIVFGRVVKYHLRSDILQEDCDVLKGPIVDLDKVQAVGRAGGTIYWPVGTRATEESNPKTKTFGGGGALNIPRPK